VGGVLVGLGLAAGAVASTGVGAVLEAIAAGIVLALAAVGIISSAGQVIAGIGVLISFYTATERATTYRELDVAGRDFATGARGSGVGTLMMIRRCSAPAGTQDGKRGRVQVGQRLGTGGGATAHAGQDQRRTACAGTETAEACAGQARLEDQADA